MDLLKSSQEILRAFEQRMCRSVEGAPPEVRDDLRRAFAMAPSTITDQAIAMLQAGLPASLPPSFLAFLRAYDHGPLEHREGGLPAVGGRHALAQVDALLRQPALWLLDLMQFSGGPSGDPVCFDLRQRGEDGEYSIVAVNHDQAPRTAWRDRATLAPHIRVVAPSFLEYLRALLGP